MATFNRLVGLFLVLGAVLPNTARAALWNWVLETQGENVSWTSPTAVPTDWTTYVWVSEYTRIEVQLGGLMWVDVTHEFGDTMDNRMSHALPVCMRDRHIDEPGTVVMDTLEVLDAATGRDEIAYTNVVLGSLFGNPITGFRGTGNTTVVGYTTSILDTQFNPANGHT